MTALIILKCSPQNRTFHLFLSFLYNLSSYGPQVEPGISTLCGKIQPAATVTVTGSRTQGWSILDLAKRLRNQDTEGPPSKVVSPFRQPIPQPGPTGLHEREVSGGSTGLLKRLFKVLCNDGRAKLCHHIINNSSAQPISHTVFPPPQY